MAATYAWQQHKAQVAARKQEMWDNATPEQQVALTQFWAREASRIRHNRLVGIICAAAILASFWSVVWLSAWTFIGVSVVGGGVWGLYQKPGSHTRWLMPDGSDYRNGKAPAPESSPTQAFTMNAKPFYEDGQLAEAIAQCLHGNAVQHGSLAGCTVQVANVDESTIRVAGKEVWAYVDYILSDGSVQRATST